MGMYNVLCPDTNTLSVDEITLLSYQSKLRFNGRPAGSLYDVNKVKPGAHATIFHLAI